MTDATLTPEGPVAAVSDATDLMAGGSFVTRGRTVTEADVAGFCALTGDWHPQHSDAEWCKSSMFGERIAHGLLLLSFAVGLVPMDYERLAALRRIEGVFTRPLKLGETIHVEGRVAAAKPLDERFALVDCIWKIVNQDGRTVARANLKVVWRLDRAEEAAS
jgi:3-hydroxybutyryl-CoA dehydratase